MKVNSIILRGKKASGKTYISNAILGLFNKKNTLRLDANNTIVSLYRSVFKNEINFDLVVFENCYNLRHIKALHKHLVKRASLFNSAKIKNVIYITEYKRFNHLEGFTIIECKN